MHYTYVSLEHWEKNCKYEFNYFNGNVQIDHVAINNRKEYLI